jgi:hypothetical protein
MRALADGKVRWGFWPPQGDIEGREGKGIWLGGEEKTGQTDSDEDGGEGEDAHLEQEVHRNEGAGKMRSVEGGSVGESNDVEGAKGVDEVRETEEQGEEESDEDRAAKGAERLKHDLGRARGFFAALDLSDGDETEEMLAVMAVRKE